MENWQKLAATRFFTEGVAAGRIVETEPAPAVEPIEGEEWAGVLRHDPIPVVSYPYEWTFSMLRDAAMLQLDLLSAALAEDMILKDSTPFNVQWRGRQPVFIDIGSFETLERGDIWVGYRQFLRQYLYPLMLTANVGIPFQPWLRGQPDGLTAEQPPPGHVITRSTAQERPVACDAPGSSRTAGARWGSGTSGPS